MIRDKALKDASSLRDANRLYDKYKIEGLGTASTYSNNLLEFVKQGEGLSLTPYNNGKTIGYGLDYYLRPDI